MTASRRRFGQEFKDELCQEVITPSRTITDVAVAYGIGPETLRNWLNKYRGPRGGTHTEFTVDERARLMQLERENCELRAETTSLKSQCLLRAGAATVSTYEHIDSCKDHPAQAIPQTTMCDLPRQKTC